jgi:hypothetical protein
MVYFSLILSLFVLALVINLTIKQKRFDLLNGALVAGALTVVVLDVDTLVTSNKHPEVGFLSLAVLLLWIFSLMRKPLDTKSN